MKLTIANYFDQVEGYLDIINADSDFLSSYNFFNKVTKNGKDLSNLDKSPEIRETFDLFLENLNKLKGKQKKPAGKPASKPAAVSSKTRKPAADSPKAKNATEKKPAKKERPAAETNAEPVEHIPSDIALVKRYVSLHDKDKSYDQVLSIWRAFNKAIVERKVTKDSPYKSEIAAMYSSLKSAIPAAQAAGSLHMVIAPTKLKAYKAIGESVEKSPGVSIMLEYINISGKVGMKERADRLNKRIERAGATGKLDSDRYAKDIKKAKAELEAYLNSETDTIGLNDYSLSGIGEIAVFGCTCDKELAGFTRSQNAVIYKLLQERVKNLHDPELDRAFADTVAPSLCKTIASKLIAAGQLTMSLLRNPAKVTGSLALNGSGGHKQYDFGTEIIDLRLRNAAAKEKNTGTGKPKNIGLSGTTTELHLPDAAPEEVKIISAQELVNRKFRTIGLRGKFRTLIGDPEPGFSGMIHGKPKQGKSTVAIEFAKDLTKLGKVLYAAIEEGQGYTLQDKVIRNNANVPGLDFANKLPSSLVGYSYVFIDSVSDARLNDDAFDALIKTYKPQEISIIGVFHATKDGKFKGSQSFAHAVDVMIRVEDGVAHAQGRYAPPSEINIAAITAQTNKQTA